MKFIINHSMCVKSSDYRRAFNYNNLFRLGHLFVLCIFGNNISEFNLGFL